MSTENTTLTVAAWRLTNTAFRSRPHEYHTTREAAETRQRDFNMSCDDGGLHNLTPLVLLAEAEKEVEDAKEDMREAQAISDQLQEDIKDLRAINDQLLKALRDDACKLIRAAGFTMEGTCSARILAAIAAAEGTPAPTAAAQSDDAEFLSKRLARVAKAVGHPMPNMPHDDIAAVAGTILGGIALRLEQAAKEPTAYRFRIPVPGGGSGWTFHRPQPELLLETQPLYAVPQAQHLPCPEFYRHIKTGGIYEAICNANAEATGELLVVYRNTKTGERWARPAAEFNDGRFERITAAELAEVDALIDAALRATGGAHG